MNLREFLLANYVYILIVIVLIIITIIGFLADKKKTKGKENSQNGMNENNNGVGNVDLQSQNNSQDGYQLIKDNVVSNNVNNQAFNMNNANGNMNGFGPVNFGSLQPQTVNPVNNNLNVIPNNNMNNNMNNSSNDLNVNQPMNINMPGGVSPINT